MGCLMRLDLGYRSGVAVYLSQPKWLSIGAALTPANQVEKSHATPGLLPATVAYLICCICPVL